LVHQIEVRVLAPEPNAMTATRSWCNGERVLGYRAVIGPPHMEIRAPPLVVVVV